MGFGIRIQGTGPRDATWGRQGRSHTRHLLLQLPPLLPRPTRSARSGADRTRGPPPLAPDPRPGHPGVARLALRRMPPPPPPQLRSKATQAAEAASPRPPPSVPPAPHPALRCDALRHCQRALWPSRPASSRPLPDASDASRPASPRPRTGAAAPKPAPRAQMGRSGLRVQG